MTEVAEQITLTRTKGSNTWNIQHSRFLEETNVSFSIVEGAAALGAVAKSGDHALVGRAIRQLELIAQAAS